MKLADYQLDNNLQVAIEAHLEAAGQQEIIAFVAPRADRPNGKEIFVATGRGICVVKSDLEDGGLAVESVFVPWQDVRNARIIQAGYPYSDQPWVYTFKMDEPPFVARTQSHAREHHEFNAVAAFAEVCVDRVVTPRSPSV